MDQNLCNNRKIVAYNIYKLYIYEVNIILFSIQFCYLDIRGIHCEESSMQAK
jgi:hypothetical protein